jgi:hypothetical protein
MFMDAPIWTEDDAKTFMLWRLRQSSWGNDELIRHTVSNNNKKCGVVMLLLLYCNDAWRYRVSIRERHVSSHVGQG